MNQTTTAPSGRATGHIDVKTYEPQPYDEPADGPELVEIHVTETFSGDIAGEGRVRFLQTGTPGRLGELRRDRARHRYAGRSSRQLRSPGRRHGRGHHR